MKQISLLTFVSLLFLTGCCPSSDDDFCVVPTTNNPSVTNAKNDSPLPQVGY